jgi:pimeloyl-ACP methyl ester carboxylesterase
MIWHGRQDHHVPPSVAEHYAQAIPRSNVTVLEQEGHFSLIERHAERIVRRLVEQVAER